MWQIIIGILCGFGAFLYNLESSSMGQVIYRDGQLRFDNILHYVKNVFVEPWLWYYDLWGVNWIIMTLFGIIIMVVLNNLLYLISYILKYMFFLESLPSDCFNFQF